MATTDVVTTSFNGDPTAITGYIPTIDQAMWWQGNATYNHWVNVGSVTYSCLEDSLNSAGVANNIAAQINASDPNCTATTGGDSGNEIFITLKVGVYGPVAVSSSDGSGPSTLTQTTVGAMTIFVYPTSGNVNFKVCNYTSGSITPPAVTLNWKVVR